MTIPLIMVPELLPGSSSRICLGVERGADTQFGLEIGLESFDAAV